MTTTALVLPHYNEISRFDPEPLLAFARRRPDVLLLLVDDGSVDGTRALLERTAARAPAGAMDVLALEANVGKAEAVRLGILRAAESGARYVGFWDGDLATPLASVDRFEALLDERAAVEMVFGARVQLLGRTIERRPLRHYLGRVFATAASMTLGIPVYDTQCGAKLFRATPRVLDLFREPFTSGWTFDVEIVARRIQALAASGEGTVLTRIHELPLDRWHDVAGSKVKALDFPRALLALLRIRRRYRLGA